MPLKLILIRHCKSSWDAFGSDDHSRVLNDRGRRSAPLIGAWLGRMGHVPDTALCSDAARTRETWALVSGAMACDTPVTFSYGLYLAPDLVMLEHLRKATGQVAALIGHNPGIAELAHGLVKTAPDHERFSDYPTGATTVLTFEAESWADVKEGSGKVVDFTVPRDLE